MTCMSRIGLAIVCGSMRIVRDGIYEMLFPEAISSINRSTCYSVPTVVIFLLGAAGMIQFSDMIFSRAPRASLSNQNPEASTVPREWHSATTASSMLPAAIQRKFFVTIGPTVDHGANL